jgi:redox-sensitive bicupin YhaK (pirin superfamily)
MIQQAKGKIFLADQRGINETEKFQRRYTFNFGKYFNAHKHAFGDIYVLNDDTLAGGGSVKMLVKEYSYIILIPVTGAIAYKDTIGKNNLVAAGQVQVITADKDVTIEISNPFREDLVNFLQIWIRAHKTKEQNSFHLSTYNDVNENLNSLVNAIPENDGSILLPFAIAVGKFSGRGETVYLPKNKTAGLFVFVIEGAFEVEGRLLHARDGLALWETAAAEMEALSNDAIILLIEY